VESDFCSEFEF